MFTFDHKPRPSAAPSPAPASVSKNPAKAPLENPLWLRLATSSRAGATASPAMSEERRPYFQPRLPPSSAPSSLIQRAASDAGASTEKTKTSAPSPSKSEDPARVQEAAMLGTSGPSGPLPFLERIQGSFGRHDVSHVQAHTDSRAAEGAATMGAAAFTTGNHIAFTRDSSLGTAAHEAAHAIQQRAGLQLPGGVGRAEDRHERHADAVAERVVQGQSSENLLNAYASSSTDARTAGRPPSTPASGRDATMTQLAPDPALNKRYEAAVAAKQWTKAAEILSNFDPADISKKLAALSADDVWHLHSGALRAKIDPSSPVFVQTEGTYLAVSYEKARAAKKWGEAAKFLERLVYEYIVDKVRALSVAEQASLRKGAGATCTDVIRALDALPQILALEASKTTLEATTKTGSGKSFGEVGSAFANLKDVSHDLKVLSTGTGIYEGNQTAQSTPGATPTDCTIWALEVLRDTFKQQNQAAVWDKVRAQYAKNIAIRGETTLSGLDVQAALQSEAGWKGIYWAPDPAYLVPKAELDHARSDEASATSASASKGTYYKGYTKDYPGLSIAQSVTNYAPEAPSDPAAKASTTKKDMTALNKLKKLPFGVMTAHGGEHMTIFTYGKVIEVHWSEAANSVDVIEQTDMDKWAVGPKSGYHYYASGAIVAPAADVDAAFK